LANNKGGKEAILDAARKVIAKSGTHKATVQSIADEAGMSKGAVYYHYKSKDEILYALIDQYLRAAISPFKTSLISSGSSDELKKTLLFGVRQRLEAMEHNQLQFYLTHEAIKSNKDMLDRLGSKYRGWVDMSELGMSRVYDYESPRLIRALAATLIAAIDGQVIQLLLDAKIVTVEELMGVWEMLVERGILHLIEDLLAMEKQSE
jgi:AcrR family transcriptional regulator